MIVYQSKLLSQRLSSYQPKRKLTDFYPKLPAKNRNLTDFYTKPSAKQSELTDFYTKQPIPGSSEKVGSIDGYVGGIGHLVLAVAERADNNVVKLIFMDSLPDMIDPDIVSPKCSAKDC